MKNVIVISAHPDDEVLGAGGTLLRHVEQGDRLYWLIATDVFEEHGFTKKRVESRHEEIKRVEKAFSITKTFILDFPTMTLTDESSRKLIMEISRIFHEVKPSIVYSVNRSDSHSDHRVLCDAVMACTKSFRYPFVERVLMYECISETEFAPSFPERTFIPQYFVDISNMMDRKLEIMRIYDSELGQHPFPRSERNIKALATFRGAIAGVEYAEAFQVVKWIDKI